MMTTIQDREQPDDPESRRPGPAADSDLTGLLELARDVRARTALALRDLVAFIEASTADNAEPNFAGLVKVSQQLVDLDDTELAKLLGVSRPTVGRWTRSISSPHPLARRAILETLAGAARDRLRSFNDR